MSSYTLTPLPLIPHRYQLSFSQNERPPSTNEIVQYLASATFPSSPDVLAEPSTRVIEWINPHLYAVPSCGKRKAFVTQKGVYVFQSHHNIDFKHLTGSFKAGRPVFFYQRKDEITIPLLLFKNLRKEDQEIRSMILTEMRHDLQTAQELQDLPYVQKIWDVCHWRTKKGYEKQGFLCEKQEGDLKHFLAQHRLRPSSLIIQDIPKLLLQIAQFAKDLSQKGFMQRDFKLQNILFNKATQTPIFIDFGGCFKTLIEPRDFRGSFHNIPPEYALLYKLQEPLLVAQNKEAITRLCVDEYHTIFTLGIIYLQLWPNQNLHAWLKTNRWDLLKGLTQDGIWTTLASMTPPDFQKRLLLLAGAEAQMFEKHMPQVTISLPPIEPRDSMEELILQMIDINPSNRPTLANVIERLNTMLPC